MFIGDKIGAGRLDGEVEGGPQDLVQLHKVLWSSRMTEESRSRSLFVPDCVLKQTSGSLPAPSAIPTTVHLGSPPATPDMSTEPASTASEPKAEAPPSAPEPSHASTASEPPAKPSPVDAFLDRLPAVLAEADYNECWGVSLNPDGENDGPTRMVLHKWLNSAQGDLELAVKNLTASLKWRKEFRPLDCVDEMHDAKFDGLGYITRNHIDGQLAVVTWFVFTCVLSWLPWLTRTHTQRRNVYAAAKSHAEVFGDLNACVLSRAERASEPVPV